LLEQIVRAATQEWQQTGQVNIAGWCARYPTLSGQLQPLLAGIGTATTPRPGVEPTQPSPASTIEPPSYLSPPQCQGEIGRFGDYRILRILGQGGMGTVLLAADPVLQRQIALKVMPPDIAREPQARTRFLREAQATAALDHEHIIAIYQVGEVGGLPYIAMPVLQGLTLEDRLRQMPPLSIPDVVRIGREVALALACAHTAGLIHRDIKPANVFLKAPHARVKVLDFGLARGVGGDQKLTKSGLILGTPSYMAPEQADGLKEVDQRCDLFSLGVVLYRALSGIQPFEAPTLMGTLSKLLMFDPEPLDRVNPQVPPALSGLVMALLAKEPTQRPPTAQIVADVLGGFLGGPAPTWVAPAPLPTAAPAGDPWASIDDEPDPTQPLAAPVPLTAPPARPWPWKWMVGLGAASLVLFAVVLLAIAVAFNPKGTLALRGLVADATVVIQRNGATIATQTGPGDVRLPPGEYTLEVANAASGVLLSTQKIVMLTNGRVEVTLLPPETSQVPVNVAVAAPIEAGANPFLDWQAARLPLAETAPDNPATLVGVFGESKLRHLTPIVGLAYLLDGQKLLSVGLNGRPKLWNATTGARELQLPPVEHLSCLALSGDGALVAVGAGKGPTLIFDTKTAQGVNSIKGSETGATAVGFHPNQKSVAIVGTAPSALLVNARTGTVEATLTGHPQALTSVAIDAKGQFLAAGCLDGNAYVWDLTAPGNPPRAIGGHGKSITCVAFHPTQGSLATAGHGGLLKIWDVTTGQEWRTMSASGPNWHALAYSRSGARLAAVGVGGTVRIWDTVAGTPLTTLTSAATQLNAVAFSPDEQRIAAGGDDHLVRQWTITTGTPELLPAGHLAPALAVAVRPDGKYVASSSMNGEVLLWESATGKIEQRYQGHVGPVRALTFAANSGLLVSGGDDGQLFWWDRRTATPRRQVAASTDRLLALAVSPDGQRLAVGSSDAQLRLVNMATGEVQHKLTGHTQAIRAVAFGTDNATLVTGSDDGHTRLWNVVEGRLITKLPEYTGMGVVGMIAKGMDARDAIRDLKGRTAGGPVVRVALNADGSQVLALALDGVVKVWNTADQKAASLMPQQITPTSTALFLGGTLRVWSPGELRTWDLRNKQAFFTEAHYLPGVQHATFTPDGGHVLTANANGTLHLHRWPGK
jgi:WD40 repeat protein